MWRQFAHDGEASSLPVCAGVSVRLRLSLRDRVWGAMRWTLGLAGAVVVLWLGAAFLAATPAAAAVAVPMVAAQQGLVKGGSTRLAGGGDGDSDSDSGSSDDGGEDKSDGDSEKSEKKESDEKESDEKSEKKESEKRDSEDKDSEDEDSEKKDASEKKDSENGDEDRSRDEDSRSDEQDAQSEEGKAAQRQADDRDEQEQPERSDDDSDSGDEDTGRAAPAQDERTDTDRDRTDGESDEASDEKAAGDSAEEDATSDDSAEEEPVGDDREDSAGSDSVSDAPAAQTTGTAEVESARDEAADGESETKAVGDAATATETQDGRDDDGGAEDDRAEPTGDEDGDPLRSARDRDGESDEEDVAEQDADGLRAEIEDQVREAVEDAESDTVRGEGAAAAGQEADGSAEREAVEAAVEIVDQVSDLSGRDRENEDDDRDDESGSVEELVRDAVRSAADESDVSEDDVRRMVDTTQEAPSQADQDSSDLQPLMASALDDEDEACDDGGDCEASGEVSLLRERGPPAERSARESDDEESDDEDRDEAELTEQVLEDRIEVDNSKEELDQEKQKLAAGATTQADYDEKAAGHAELEKRAAENRDELSEDEVELVDEVVDGHRELSKREKELAEDEKKVAVGGASEASHQKNVSDYEERRDEVYEATDELMEATDRAVRTVSEDDLDGEGSAAGCGSNGAFTACGSVSESADGERDSERKLCLSGVSSGCGASSESGGSKADASCDESGCGSTASSRGADGEVTSASSRCDGDARGCRQSSKATRDGASAECESGGGSCRGESRGPGRGDGDAGADRRTASSASCTGDCGLSSRADRDGAEASCGTAGGACDSRSSGSDAAESDVRKVSTVDDGGRVEGTGAERESNGSASCVARGGACDATSETRVDNGADAERSAFSTAAASVDCGDAGACSGEAGAKTAGTVTGTPSVAGAPAPVRETSAASTCAATDGGCVSDAASRVGDAAASTPENQHRSELTASSTAGSQVLCAAPTCNGRGWSTMSGAASGDVVGVRSSTGGSSCTAQGAGGDCSTATDTTVADREPVSDGAIEAAGMPVVSGPVSVSNAGAQVRCAGGAGTCGGTTVAETSARDTAVSPFSRGTRATADCTATGGGCAGEATSSASSAPDFVAVDPVTGLPLPGQPASGPTSTASSSAGVQCTTSECRGTVSTSSAAWDGAVAGGTPRISTGGANCYHGTGGCDAQSVSHASTGAGAALALGGPQIEVDAHGNPVGINTARLVAGPSAASAAGASLACQGALHCDGKAASASTATDPTVSPDPRRSWSEGNCEGVTGGVCQAVTNSAASTGPDANIIAPLIAGPSTANATVAEGTTDPAGSGGGAPVPDQPAVPLAPAAPGSSANTGGPTVPGASSWTMASATLDCPGGTGVCAGRALSAASGSDGPDTMNGTGAARGPPVGGSVSTGSCQTAQAGCQARTGATAGTGQVVADIVAEQQNSNAAELAMQAEQAKQVAAEAAWIASRAGATAEQAKAAADAAHVAEQARQTAVEAAELAARPVENAPSVLAQSTAGSLCAGPGCAGRTSGATTGKAGDSRTEASCVASATGCAVTSDATAVLAQNAAVAGRGRTSSTVVCPEAGCVGDVTGTVNAVLSPDVRKSHSTASGTTGCDGTGPCQATITAASTTSISAPDDAGSRSVTTSAQLVVVCDNGSAVGCSTRASSETAAVGAAAVRATSNATCDSAAVCQVGTDGYSTDGLGEASATCTGTGCRIHTEGAAQASAPGGINRAGSGADCAAGPTGRCVGTSQVGATDSGAIAAAMCQGGAGSTCSHSFWANSAASGAGGGASGKASASGAGSGTFGRGYVATSAAVVIGPGSVQASASCRASAGVRCSHSYQGRAADFASYSDGTHRSWARASARGSGGGGEGGGGVFVYARAGAGKGFSNAAAGCSGAANCTAGYSSHAEASQTVGAMHGEAWADCSGGGTGGFCGTVAAVEVDDTHASAVAGCSGTGSCSTHFATSSTASFEADGFSGDAGGDCSGGGASGGFCATSAIAVYDPESGKFELSSSCATEGGTCSRHAGLTFDAASPNGELTGEGQVHCAGGVGSCGIVGLAKYHPATTDAEGNPIPPTLEIGTNCQVEGDGACSQHSRGDVNIVSPDGKITGVARSECSGTTGWCSTVVAGGFDPETGEIVATSDCQSGGDTACQISEAHINGEASGPGQAKPNGPKHGTEWIDGYSDCVQTSGFCGAYGVFKYHPAEYLRDDFGNIIEEDGESVVIPAHVTGMTGCYPAGEHCSQDLRSSGEVAQQNEHESHTGDARAGCSGSWGTCSIDLSVAYNPDTGRVEAYASCESEAGSGAACAKPETHADAWAESPDGTLHGDGRSDCVQNGGYYCSSAAMAKFYDATATLPAHVEYGAGCATDGAEEGCSFAYSGGGDVLEAPADRDPQVCGSWNGYCSAGTEDGAQPSAEAETQVCGSWNAYCSADTKGVAEPGARGEVVCADSGNVGADSCSVAADVTWDPENNRADVVVWCQSSNGTSCSYSGHAIASSVSGRNNAESEKRCGTNANGICRLSVATDAAGEDRARQGQASATGFCEDSNGTCSGEFRTHVDSNRDTLSDCHSAGNGMCFGIVTAGHAMSGGESDQTLYLHSVAPGREEYKECSPSAPCGREWVEELGGEYSVLDVERQKSLGGFLKNTVRDVGENVVYFLPGAVEAASVEVGNWITFKDWEPGLEGYAEAHPFTGGIAQGGVNFFDRWLKNGPNGERLGDDYYDAPISTLLEDLGTVALGAGGLGAVLKGASLGAKAGGAAAARATMLAGIPGTLASMGWAAGRAAPIMDAAARGAFRVATTPYRLNVAAGRMAAGLTSRYVITPASRSAYPGSGSMPRRVGSTPETAANVGRLGPDANCVNAVCAYRAASDPEAVIPRDIPRAGPGSHDPASARDTVEGVFGGRFRDSSRAQFERDTAGTPDGTEVVVWSWRDGAPSSHMIYGRRNGGEWTFYDQRGRLTDEQARAQLDDAQKVLMRGSGGAGGARSDVSNVPPVGSAQPPGRSYDPTTRSMKELQRDLDATPRAGETPAQAGERARAADAEYWTRAVDTYEALGDRPPTINIRVNDEEHRGVAHTIDRHGPQVPLRRFDTPNWRTGNLMGRILGEWHWRERTNFAYRWFDRSLVNEVINRHLQENWEQVRQDLSLHDRHEVTSVHEHAVGEGFRNANYQIDSRHPKPVYSQTNVYTITLDLLHPLRGPPVIRVVRAFPNGRGFMEKEKKKN